MATKTFKADSMLQTLQLVQAELGADAIVVSMREIPLGPSWNPWNKTSVEIIAASADAVPDLSTSQPVPQAATSPASILRPSENKNGVEFVEEIPQIEWVTKPEKPVVEKFTPPSTGAKADSKPATPNPVAKPQADDKYLPPSLKKIQQQLISQDVDNTLIDGLLNVALETLSPGTLSDSEASKKSITQLLGAELRVQQGAGTYVSSNVICLIGASGSGKTSTIAKLALFFSQKLQKTVTWVCADTIRIGAIAESRAFTDALGLKLKLVYTPEDLKEIFQNREESDLFLVDTPGYNPCNESQITELGALLAELPKRCTYLVAPATTKETDLYQLSAALGIFNLDGLIITKLDETHTFGSVYNFARKNQLPLSFFTTGKETARNLEVSDPARLVAALFGKEWNK